MKNKETERFSRRVTTARARRFSRHQEALTIGWLRSLARSSSSTSTTAAKVTTEKGERDG